MKLYFSSGQIPELKELTRPQRKAVLQCALEAFYFDDVSRVWFGTPWIVGGIFGGAMMGWGLASLSGFSHPKLASTFFGLGGAAIGLFLATQINFTRLRPYLRRVVEERKNEIAKIH
ncbi:MAG TPA: hypothetical protein VFE51_06020 [Verrucomicrobiae bacterium]|nr:hypothetical protein [Verrucomicrobiae bacterium]